jgi:hypothetical protein
MTSNLQACDHGIIQNLKFHYRKLLLRKHLAVIKAKQDFRVNILNACHLLHAAWSLVTSAKTKNCFIHAEFCSTPMDEPSEENEMKPTLGKKFNCVPKLLNASPSLNEYITVDENITMAQMLTMKIQYV